MELDSSRLKLQEVTESDIIHIHELNSYPEVDEYNTLGIPESDECRKGQEKAQSPGVGLRDNQSVKPSPYRWR